MDNVFACENCGKKFLAKEVLQHDAYCPCGETIIAYSIDAADHIAELEAQLAAAQERERWIPVTEHRPERGQHVQTMAVMEYDGEDHWIVDDAVIEPGIILAWRELPDLSNKDVDVKKE